MCTVVLLSSLCVGRSESAFWLDVTSRHGAGRHAGVRTFRGGTEQFRWCEGLRPQLVFPFQVPCCHRILPGFGVMRLAFLRSRVTHLILTDVLGGDPTFMSVKCAPAFSSDAVHFKSQGMAMCRGSISNPWRRTAPVIGAKI